MNFIPIFTKTPKNALQRTLASRAGRIPKDCECPEPAPYKIVQEKTCKPCSILSWKPKTRRCMEANIQKEVEEDADPTPLKCDAGMVIKRPFSACKKENINPHKKKLCLGKPAPPPKLIRPEPARPIPIPKPTWESPQN